jgi:hypothetical protein
MPLINLFLALVVFGVPLWLVNRFIPMQGTDPRNPQWRRGYCGRPVAIESIWAL